MNTISIKKISRICFVAGHSGGHIIPSLTRAQQLVAEQQAQEILFFSTTSALDKKIVTGNGIITKLVLLNVKGVPYKNKLLLPLFVGQLVSAFFSSLYHLIKTRPQKIISMGGYVSLPVCLAGWLLRIPLELYELNVEPGKAIKFLAPFAQKIWIIYPESNAYLSAHKCEVAEYPIRFSRASQRVSRESALTALNLSPERKTVFVLGGSQGSLFLNTLMRTWIEDLAPELKSRLQIIHQTGEQDRTDWKNFYEQWHIPAIVFSYHHQLEQFYQAADLVLSRAGAGTLAELSFFQKKSLIVPLEAATTSHQLHNAHAFVKKNSSLFFVARQREIEQQNAQTFSKIKQLLEL